MEFAPTPPARWLPQGSPREPKQLILLPIRPTHRTSNVEKIQGPPLCVSDVARRASRQQREPAELAHPALPRFADFGQQARGQIVGEGVRRAGFPSARVSVPLLETRKIRSLGSRRGHSGSPALRRASTHRATSSGRPIRCMVRASPRRRFGVSFSTRSIAFSASAEWPAIAALAARTQCASR